MCSKLAPAIWSRDTGHGIPFFDRCQLTKKWMSNVKDVGCKQAGVWPPRWALNLSLRYGHVIMVTLAYMERWTYGRTDKLSYFLTHGAPRAELRYKHKLHQSNTKDARTDLICNGKMFELSLSDMWFNVSRRSFGQHATSNSLSSPHFWF